MVALLLTLLIPTHEPPSKALWGLAVYGIDMLVRPASRRVRAFGFGLTMSKGLGFRGLGFRV